MHPSWGLRKEIEDIPGLLQRHLLLRARYGRKENLLLLWCLPACLAILGAFWKVAQVWALGGKKCHRRHCYITGPLYLIAGMYVVLAKFGYMPFQAGFFLLTVVAIWVLAHIGELSFGKYLRSDVTSLPVNEPLVWGCHSGTYIHPKMG